MKKIFSILSYILVVISFVLVFVGLLFSMTLSEGKAPSVFGYSILVVSSGSMTPDYPINTVVFTKEIDIEDCRVGDVITFYSDNPEIYNLPVTHRINEIKPDDNGNLSVITKGDANYVCDEYPVYQDNIIGKVIMSSNFLGKLFLLLSNKFVFLFLIIIPLFLVCFFSIKDIVKTIKNPEEVGLVEEQDE